MARQDIISGTWQPVSNPPRLRANFIKCDDNFTELYADVAELQGWVDPSSVAVTATANGLTTGLIPATANFVTVTSANADHQISLPAATVGKTMTIKVGSTGCELIAVTAADKVNNVVVGATNEAALTANCTYYLQYVAANTWIMMGWTNLGAVETAIVPDARA